ncbi:hypothetical protein [Kribbella sp. NPDC006257]|uniref:hypothetical protein n=1 Tax=Kribbella sp. NPDC006257 TaxID=3156738 RepID=UPI0033B40C6E
MSRLIAGTAVLLAATAMTCGLTGCKDSSTSSAPAPQGSQTTGATDPAGDSDQTPPDDAGTTPSAPADTTPAPSGGGGEVCDDLQFITQLAGDLQQGKAPSDRQGTSARINKWVQEIPAEIQRPGQGVTGPIVIALRHPDAAGEVSTDAVKQDVVELNAWHDKNC